MVLVAAAQQPADPVQRVAGVPAVAQVSCCTRRRTSSTASKPSRMTWKASSTRVACGRVVRSAVA